jgi:tRNA nucleotidyltransferase (CCA-adding enzyme)
MVCPKLTSEIFQTHTEDRVWHTVLQICSELIGVGARPYFVGGCVRDAILGKRLVDFDMEVFGIPPNNIERILESRWTVKKTGKAFCVLKVEGVPIDISVPRIEVKTGHGHADFTVNFLADCDIKTAASRRDFTINSLYFDVANGKIVDEFRGVEDLETGVLRHVGEKF